MSIEGCTDWLKDWLERTSNICQTNREVLLFQVQTDPYSFEDHKWDSNYHSSQTTNSILYWSMFRHTRAKNLTSSALKEFFRFVELAPLLCVLDDFLEPLDSFLAIVQSDTGSAKLGTPLKIEADNVLAGADVGKEPSPEVKFKKDADEGLYLEGLELLCLLKCRLQNIKFNWKNVVDRSFPKKWRDFVEVHRTLSIDKLKSLIDHVSLVVMENCCQDSSRPRFMQLCDKLQLTEKERDAMTYIFIQNVGVLFVKLYYRFASGSKEAGSVITGNHSNSMAMAAAAFAGMTGREMYEFFSEGRSHLQQELFGAEDEFSSLLGSSFLQMSPTVAKACCGGTLSAEETYKIDKTILAEILASEKELSSRKEPNKKDNELSIRDASLGEEEEKKKEEKGVTEREGGRREEDSETEGGVVELEEILRACNDIQQTALQQEEAEESSILPDDHDQPRPYKNDLEYLEDNFDLIETLVKARKTETSDDSLILRSDQRKPEAVIREMKAKARSLKAKIEQRMDSTRKAGDWLPRLERLAELRRLNKFEKNVLLTLTGCMVSRNLRDSGHSDSVFRHHINIGMLIGLFCEGLEEQINARVYFYQNSHLVKEGLLHVSDPPLLSRGNFLDCGVELDRRLLDYIVGLDTEINELVDGSDLYTPDTDLADVALPVEQRTMILNAFDSFHRFKKTCKDLKLNTRGSSKGLCMLFYGPSGTGKTMTANAVAKHLNKKILLVTVSLLNETQITKDLLRFIFREAKIHNAIIFFDECEPIFESRDNRPNLSLALMLTEIEQYDDIIILATNRHQDLDEAMHRRIQLALPFSVPDYTLRMEIWRSHVPDQLLSPQGGEIEWETLAQTFELTGGLIRNAVLSAISLASKKTLTDDTIHLTFEDLYNGAKQQLRGLLEMVDFERRVIPTFGLEEIILDDSTRNIVDAIINTGKTHKFISTQWGFASTGQNENVAHAGGVVCLLCGAAGVGKTSVAHAIAYELGQPIKEANCSELLSHTVTTNPRASKGIATFFRDAQRANAIVVLDGSEFIFGSVSGTLISGLIGCETYSLAYQIEQYPGMVILTSRQEAGLLDIARVPHLRYIVSLRPPSISLREKIWRQLLPKKAPLAPAGIDFPMLAERYSINGGQIAFVICAAAEKAATSDETVISTELLSCSAEEYLLLQESGRNHHLSLFQ